MKFLLTKLLCQENASIYSATPSGCGNVGQVTDVIIIQIKMVKRDINILQGEIQSDFRML